jgi:hypothetical protein
MIRGIGGEDRSYIGFDLQSSSIIQVFKRKKQFDWVGSKIL